MVRALVHRERQTARTRYMLCWLTPAATGSITQTRWEEFRNAASRLCSGVFDTKCVDAVVRGGNLGVLTVLLLLVCDILVRCVVCQVYG